MASFDHLEQSNMSLYQSASNIRVDDGHLLRASVQNGDGDWVDSELDLDQFIGNNNGRFEWGAEEIDFNMEGENGDVPVLRAQLYDVDGNLVDADINLDERVANDNGNLIFAWQTTQSLFLPLREMETKTTCVREDGITGGA
ncbi:reverse transcriptase [Purpureocillium lavendulum]|uniref:Reverse transcriptase n=1 Tax=Purpureocillium lavendulum TaxID=1247861 RepID=A0AB34FC17_9HYPO|nr:reverse transcriptase [Purpureocillium lavendulum]